MTMLTVTAEQPQPSRQELAAADRSAPRKVTGKLKVAIDAMVWAGSRRDEAAAQAGLSVHGLREALRKPHVKAYYLSLLEVLRTSERARNIHTLAEVRDQQTNQMARVQAVKALEQLEDSPTSSSARMQSPGFVIVVQPQPAAPARSVDTNAANIRTIEHEQDQEPDKHA